MAAVAWWAALAALAIFTANPVTLNRDQIARADQIVTATIPAETPLDHIAIERVWRGQGLQGTVAVGNLAETDAKPGTEYIVPLSRQARGLHVTRTRIADGVPLIYPATPDALDQLQSILGRPSEAR